MPTVRELMGQLTAGEITVEELVDQFRRHPPEVRVPPQSLQEAYEHAEDMPGDNETFWIDAAYHQHVIDDSQYDRLFDAISAGRALPFTTDMPPTWEPIMGDLTDMGDLVLMRDTALTGRAWVRAEENWATVIVFTPTASSIGPQYPDALGSGARSAGPRQADDLQTVSVTAGTE
jgi:hypothetical protein